jgi:protein SCO1/2
MMLFRWKNTFIPIVLLLSTALFLPSKALAQALGGNFTLTAHDGSRFELAMLKGKTVLIYFGFTHCPDVCPMELSNIARALTVLDNEQVSGLFITIDPARDTVERLASYMPFFHPKMLGLTGTAEEIKAVAEQYRITYNRVEQRSGYSMDHSSHIFVLDANGVVRALAPFGSNADHLVRLIQGIVADAPQ